MLPLRDRWARGLALVLAPMALALAPSPARAVDPEHRIIGGGAIPVEQAPWQVALAFNRNLYQGGGKERFACGGALVAPNVVLTAAHCVYGTPVANGTFNGPEQFEVYVGRSRLSSGQGQVIPVAAVRYLVSDAAGVTQLESVGGADVGTQLYETTHYSWDLAVLSLSTPATVGTPAPLAGADERKTWRGGITALVSGWGALTQSPPYGVSDDLYAVQVPIASDETCAENHGEDFSLGSQLCAGPHEGGYGTCRGDSGGPLAVPVEVGASIGVRLIGLNSLGGPNYCSEPGFIEQYTRVSDASIRDAIVRGIQPFVSTPLVGSGARPYAPPRTKVDKHPKRHTRHRTARFSFAANEPATFECKLDRSPWTPCATPFRQKVAKGKHKFKVRATDSFGQLDPSAAKFRWKVKRKRR